ncbi:MAG: hypothetical protein KIS67_27180 [Verrucomicrobiae bacterium]|nr:hypothetical protein [Verrucomicrobiae bacterium]
MSDDLGKLIVGDGTQHCGFSGIQFQANGRCRTTTLRKQPLAKCDVNRRFLDQHFETSWKAPPVAPAFDWPVSRDPDR